MHKKKKALTKKQQLKNSANWKLLLICHEKLMWCPLGLDIGYNSLSISSNVVPAGVLWSLWRKESNKLECEIWSAVQYKKNTKTNKYVLQQHNTVSVEHLKTMLTPWTWNPTAVWERKVDYQPPPKVLERQGQFLCFYCILTTFGFQINR